MSSQPDEVAARVRRLTATDQFTLVPLAGGASDRWYYRVTGPLAARYERSSLVLMVVAPELSAILDSHIRVGRCLDRHAVPVPQLFGEWVQEGVILLEDFGDTTMTEAVARFPDRRDALYEGAIDVLARVHRCVDDRRDPCPAFDLHFDVGKFQYEFDFHVRRWVIEHRLGITPTPTEEKTLSRAFQWISATLAAEPRVFTHRDYQTSNLMVRDGILSGVPQLGLLDFQDARQGLRQYDLASLLFDSYAEVAPGERERLTGLYCRLTGTPLTERFLGHLTVAAIQRKLHDAGAFIYAAVHRGKDDYLRHVPGTLRLAIGLMATVPECRGAGELIEEYLLRRGGA